MRSGELNPAQEDHLKIIEDGADRLLEEVGLRFEGDGDTLDLWKQAGARVNNEHVYLDGAWLRRVIRGSAPSQFVLKARNPVRSSMIGAAARPVFAPIYGAPNVLSSGARRGMGTLKAYRELVALAHSSPAIANTGHMICVPSDVPEAARPMEMALAHLSYSDKPFMGCVTSARAAQQVIDAVALAVDGVAEAAECYLLHLINSTPPLTFQENPLSCLRMVARKRQACLISSYMMMGATSPVTVAGTLIQGYAEVLAGLALTQLWWPGTPVVMGLVAIPFSMRSMLPCYGDPASHHVQLLSVQLARRLGIPARGDGATTSSMSDDAQAGYQGSSATAISVAAGADFILHSIGSLENLRCVSINKFQREARALELSYCDETVPCAAPLPLDPAVTADLRARVEGARCPD